MVQGEQDFFCSIFDMVLMHQILEKLVKRKSINSVFIKFLVLLLVTGGKPTLKQNDHIQKNCAAAKDPRSTNEACMGKVELADILEEDVGEDNIFFLETSEKKTITPRESCGIESAARYVMKSIVYKPYTVLSTNNRQYCLLIIQNIVY